MKVSKLLMLLGFTFFLLFGCDKNEENDLGSDMLAGYWINPQYQNDTITYQRSTALIDNEYGLQIRSNHKLIERKNSGWCGTPPVAYADFEGSWSKDDSIIRINVGYWGGTTEIKWKLISVDNKELKVNVLNIEYAEDQ